MSNPQQPDPTWLSLAQVADRLGVTDRTIRNYVASGALPAHRVNGSRLIRIKAHDVDALLRPIPTSGGDAA